MKYFIDLGKTINELNLQNSPNRVWNIDETNVSLTQKPAKILAETGQHNVQGRVGNCRDGVTVLTCINAAGGDVPPLVIVKGQTDKTVRAYNVSLGPYWTKYTHEKKAWLKETLGDKWFKDHFRKPLIKLQLNS